MNEIWFYALLARRLRVRYVTKVLSVAFVGTHLPLLALIGFFVLRTAPSLHFALEVLGVALVATLGGTALTLLALTHLLRPIVVTSRALRTYVAARSRPALPTIWTDEVGTLMADTTRTLVQLDDTLDELAYFDPVTGLPNRELLLRRLRERMGPAQPFALCVLTQHDHERLLVAFGQETVDALVRALGLELEAKLPRDSLLARVAPNQFAFVLSPQGMAAEQILAAMPGEITAGGASCMPELAAGLAWHPADAATPEALLTAAVAALPRADAAERVAFYAPASREAARERLNLERDLRRALETDGFRLHFQPVVRATTGQIVGAEALIRWQHPRRVTVPPNQFIPVVESIGLSDALGNWVLQSACRHLRTWSDAGLPPVRLAVNLSAGQFGSPGLVNGISAALRAQRIDPSWLEIELTETATMRDPDCAAAVFNQLHEIGVTVAIDDFGTGYSSMSRLQQLKPDKLKIDRSFVTDVDSLRGSRAICKALIELSHGFGFSVQAEGTESAAEVATLQALGCDLFQGYYFARALPAEEFAVRLRAGPTLQPA